MKETIISTQEIYSGRIINLAVHEVTLPNGERSKREIIKHPGAVAIIALDHEQNVLLVRQYRLAADEITLEIPAGTLHPGEDPQLCAIRELREETGYRPGQIQAIGGIHPAPGYTSEYIHLYIATDLEAAALDLDEDEFIELVRVTLPEALAMIDRGEIHDGKSTAGLLLAARRLGVS
jgi:ADP-ribose pyrophosphatase